MTIHYCLLLVIVDRSSKFLLIVSLGEISVGQDLSEVHVGLGHSDRVGGVDGKSHTIKVGEWKRKRSIRYT
jgi:hypothetical protein